MNGSRKFSWKLFVRERKLCFLSIYVKEAVGYWNLLRKFYNVFQRFWKHCSFSFPFSFSWNRVGRVQASKNEIGLALSQLIDHVMLLAREWWSDSNDMSAHYNWFLCFGWFWQARLFLGCYMYRLHFIHSRSSSSTNLVNKSDKMYKVSFDFLWVYKNWQRKNNYSFH